MDQQRTAHRATAVLEEDEATIWDAVCSMYDAYLSADRPRADAHIGAECTMWDSANAPLIRGLDQLNALRDSRPENAGPHSVSAISVLEPVIDIWDDTALVRHVLVVEFIGGPTAVTPERIRNTGVWRRRDGGWTLVHNHEDTMPEGIDPLAASAHEALSGEPQPAGSLAGSPAPPRPTPPRPAPEGDRP